MKFDGVCLITESVPALVDFYARLFCAGAVGDDTHTELSIAGLNLAIFSREGMEQMAPGSTEHAGHGSLIIGFNVDDVDAEYERLKGLNVEFVKLPATYPWGTRSVWIRDPDGNIINFFSRV